MKKRFFLFGLILFATFVVIPMDFGAASEVRTLELFPVADSFVSYSNPQDNFGKEQYLRTDYENKTVIEATSFDVNTTSRQLIDISLPKNGMIMGSFDVVGEGDINFSIKNEAETVAYLEEFFVKSLNFYFFAPYTGNYRLSFENLGSLVPARTVSLSDVILTMEPFGVMCSPIFLLFDLSDIPAEATINIANLSLSFESAGVNTYNIVKAFYCSKTNWDEQTITYENAPLSQSYLIESSSLNMSSVSIGTRCETDIKSDVVRSLPEGKLTEVIAIVDGELASGMVEFFSRESENKPKLEITYTYASVACFLSSTFLIEGQGVAANVTTDPVQTLGNVKIQYSTDQVNWIDAGQFPGGAQHYIWTPPASGQVYVRGVWETSWNDGYYNALSSVSTLYVIPVYLLVVISVAIIVAITGVYFWKKKGRRNPPKQP